MSKTASKQIAVIGIDSPLMSVCVSDLTRNRHALPSAHAPRVPIAVVAIKQRMPPGRGCRHDSRGKKEIARHYVGGREAASEGRSRGSQREAALTPQD